MFQTRGNFRYFSIIDGASLTNEDEGGDPRYYGYTRPGGSWVIMRYNVATGLYAFHLNNGQDSDLSQFDTDWTARVSLTYIRSGEMKKL